MTSSREPLQPMPRKVIVLVAAGIALFTMALVIGLWWAGTAGLSGKDLVTARLDALRTGLSIGLGGGGLFALYLAWRRQHATEVGLVQKERDQSDVMRAYELQAEVAEHNRLHAERVASATEKDAADRRVTELYTKASEQLGSEKAPVRLAGIYALERLAQDNPGQRQTIVNLLCAYLRMPYLPPGDKADADHRERVQELEVRRTAQRVLASHLRSGDKARFWKEARGLDLRGATLVDAAFDGCSFIEPDFGKAVFVGDSDFTATTFTALAVFVGAVFQRTARFTNAKFVDSVFFVGATFHRAEFVRTTFGGVARFEEARFQAVAREPVIEAHRRQTGADRPGDYFRDAQFQRLGTFERATFENGVDFRNAAGRVLRFGGANFRGVTWFDRTATHVGCLSEDSYADSPAVASADAASEHSIWPEHWVISEDGVIGERSD